MLLYLLLYSPADRCVLIEVSAPTRGDRATGAQRVLPVASVQYTDLLERPIGHASCRPPDTDAARRSARSRSSRCAWCVARVSGPGALRPLATRTARSG